MLRLLVLTILLSTLLSGCARKRFDDQPQRPDFMSASASGKRLVITDENGQPTLKIRARKNAWKVYDENFHAAGFIRWPDKTAPHVENLVREKLAQFQSVGSNNEVFELPGHLRIEKIQAGWAVFNQEAKLLGLFEHDSSAQAPDAVVDLPADALLESDLPVDIPTDPDQTEQNSVETKEPASMKRWTLRTSYNTPVLWTASQDNRQIIARHQDGKTFTGNATYFSAPAMLAGKLEELSALERAALAAWFIHMMPDA